MTKRQKWQALDTTGFSDEQYQSYILQGVSRTFALTIPQMPPALELLTGNAYLLCRITDTIEDDAALNVEQKHCYIQQFLEVLSSQRDAAQFSAELLPLLGEHCSPAELDLISHTDRVVRMTHSFSVVQQQCLQRCVKQMAVGMAHFQQTDNPFGLSDLAELDCYCYHVAGVVGEMLAELFCDYSEAMEINQQQLMSLSVHFGQGLQMTNILKDVREDMRRGVNWLPADLFVSHGVDLQDLPEIFESDSFVDVIRYLVAITHGHLCKALTYPLLIPKQEKGIRRFCLWAIGMAMQTLKKINADPHYRNISSTKISRASLKRIIVLSNFTVGHDALIKVLFAMLARGLPDAVYRPLNAADMAARCALEHDAESGSKSDASSAH